MKEQGTIKWFNVSAGYGFILIDGSNKEVFVHHSGLNAPRNEKGLKEIYPNDRVEFEVEQTDKGPKAVDVNVLTEVEA